MTFVKAVIEEVTAGPDAPKRVGKPFTVQLNPASLRLQMASTVDFGKDTGRQKIQYQGSTSTLSFDLVFDTADEGTTDVPVDVRTKTRHLERFVLPTMNQVKSVPPRLRFTYGTFSVVGVMTALNQDFDLFAGSGVPLRAKCAVTIKEQRPEFDAAKAGSGANTGAGATPPVGPGAPGTGGGRGGTDRPGGAGGASPTPPPDRSATAVAGESAADFAARMGLDPRAWKTLSGIDDPLHLVAGQVVAFSTAASAAIGMGAPDTTGPPRGDEPAGSLTGTRTASLAPEELTATGGLARALDAEQSRAALTAAQQASAAFDRPNAPSRLPDTGGAARTGGAGGTIGTAVSGGSARISGPSTSTATSTGDQRARTYGFGVPLRPRSAPPGGDLALVRRRASAAPADSGPPTTLDPTVPRWRMPAASAAHDAQCSGCSSSTTGSLPTPTGGCRS